MSVLIALLMAVTTAEPTPRAPAPPRPAPPPPIFAGVVVGPAAKPVADAVVVLMAPSEFQDPPIIVRTAADGVFRVQAKRRGAHAIRVEARGLAAQTIEKASPGSAIRVTLAPGGTIEGTVRDASTGTPVAGARVEAREETRLPMPWDASLGIVTTQTDARGAFKLEGLARGRHTVTASSRGAGRASQSGVALGQRVALLTVAGASIHGRVLAPDGKPVAGATLRAEGDTGFAAGQAGVSDAAGRYDLGGLVAGSYRVTAHHKDWAAAAVSGIRVERLGDAEADVTLSPPFRITGRLVDGSEGPVSGTIAVQEIDGQPVWRSLSTLLRAEAGADGRFAIERVPPGSHALAVNGRGMTARRVPIDVGGREPVVDLGDVVLEAGPQIKGRVRDKAGAPVVDATVRAMPEGRRMPGVNMPLEGRTDGEGRFVLGGATSGTYRVIAQAPGYAAALSPALDAPGEVDLVLEAAGGIAGAVVDPEGRPVDTFEVIAQPPGAREGAMMRMGPRARAVIDEGGRFTLDDVSAGTYVVTIAAGDLGRGVVSDVKVASGAVTDVGRVRLSAGGIVRGTVVDGSGAAVVGATVDARRSDRMFTADDFRQVSTDAAGAFQLRGIAPGRVVVMAHHPDFAEGRSAPIDVDPARPSQATVVMTRGGRVEGVVRRRGAGPADLVISVHSQEEPASFSMSPGVTPGPDGSYALDRVPPGEVGVSLMAGQRTPGGTPAIFKQAVVREGETTRVDFVLRDILLTGKVTRGGTPLANVRLTARSQTSGAVYGMMGGAIPAPTSGPQRMTAVTREDGSYEMIVGDSGRLMIRADAVGGRQSYPTRTVEIADADAQTVDIDFPTGGLSGIVVDEQTDAPVAGAFVVGQPAKAGGPNGGAATTSADGRFSIDTDAGEFLLRVRAEGYASDSVTVSVTEGRANDVRIRLSRGAPLRGKVVDARGRPAPGLGVMARPDDDAGGAAGADSAADGRFEFAALKPGMYTLTAGSGLVGFALQAGVSPGAEEVVLRLTPGGRLRVTVKTPDGAPVDHAFVSVRSVNGTRFALFSAAERTAADGTATLDVPAGAVEVEAETGRGSGRGQAQVAAGGLGAVEVTVTEAPATAP
jgi:protocatechuate 3,4-dioxygenase beta subunit